MLHKTVAQNELALERRDRDTPNELQFLRDEIAALLGATAMRGDVYSLSRTSNEAQSQAPVRPADSCGAMPVIAAVGGTVTESEPVGADFSLGEPSNIDAELMGEVTRRLGR